MPNDVAFRNLLTLSDLFATESCAGGVAHHPSNVPHSSRINDKHLIAAWRWTSDIRYETYLLKN